MVKNMKSTRIKIIAASIVAVAVLATIVTVVIVSSSPRQIAQTTEEDPVDKNFTDMQKVYYHIETDTQLEELEEVAKSINKEIKVKIDGAWGGITLEDSDEYITFEIVTDKVSGYAESENVVYYDTVNGKESYILQSGYIKYQHFNGSISNEFDTIEDAINDHISYTKETL